MDNPLVGLTVFVVFCAGLVLLWQGWTGSERNINRLGGVGLRSWVNRWEDSPAHDESSRRHRAESNRGRLMTIGAGLIVIAIGASVWLMQTA
jgi:hypothetical protein